MRSQALPAPPWRTHTHTRRFVVEEVEVEEEEEAEVEDEKIATNRSALLIFFAFLSLLEMGGYFKWGSPANNSNNSFPARKKKKKGKKEHGRWNQRSRRVISISNYQSLYLCEEKKKNPVLSFPSSLPPLLTSSPLSRPRSEFWTCSSFSHCASSPPLH